MLERLLRVIYWAACLLAAFSVALAVIVILDPGPDAPIWVLRYIGAALGIWLLGWIIRYVLIGTRSVKPWL